MQYDYANPILARADAVAAQGHEINEIYRVLRQLPLADFCSTMFDGAPNYEHLARALPAMPPADTQRRWTGHSGRELLTKSCNIIRLLQVCSYSLRKTAISGNLLDYGCGWGRLTRLLAYFGDASAIYGVDPMQDSLDACRKYGVHGRFLSIPTKPESMPLGGANFDFGVAYSVFTHTPPRVTGAILHCLRGSVSRNGVFACTIRPVEFWSLRRAAFGNQKADALESQHRHEGFAFLPIGGGLELHEDEYGDTSMTIEFFSDLASAAGWEVGFIDRDSMEPFQIMVGLTPKT